MTTRATLSEPFTLEGVAVHHGGRTRARLHPAEDGGIVFIRHGVRIPARIDFVVRAAYGVTLGSDGETVGVVEHLLAALAMRGISDARVEMDGPEVPILDGSARDVADALDAQPLTVLSGEKPSFSVTHPVECVDENRCVSVRPGEDLALSVTIDYPHPAIGRQQWSGRLDWDGFCRDIAPARTFGFLSDRKRFASLGMARGAGEENTVIFDADGPLGGESLRFADEPVRHKVLDLIGDLALLGRPLRGIVASTRGGHELNVALVRRLAACASP